eukprot:TRINITY_DN4157_c0_g2_i1.p1 TRINITY_DN4157_c0_g2~~TRINITY_DN4157_c0_g2_i1.p1  ORF type:complete len:550 (-),score=88.09 TRINITY_DN4157_c0_g2_i1:398-2047(-)
MQQSESRVCLHIDGLRSQLRRATKTLTSFGLMHSAKWASNLLVGIPRTMVDSLVVEDPILLKSEKYLPKSDDQDAYWTLPQISEDEEDVYLYAKALFDRREYGRCAHALIGVIDCRGFFLHLYASYLDGERLREQEIEENPDTTDKSIKNPNLDFIAQQLSDRNLQGILDPFCQYMLGIVLQKMERHKEAQDAFLSSVRKYPWNISAWEQLLASISTITMAGAMSLPNHWTSLYFYGLVYNKFHQGEKAHAYFQALQTIFQNSTDISTQMALASYNGLEYDRARREFESVCQNDPFQVEHMDAFSDILFVQDSVATLSYLAQKMNEVDKYSPETCNIIANYYSQKGDYAKAIEMCNRTLTLDRRNSRAWMLLGQAHFEQKESHLAIRAYGQALEIDPQDYRCWNGLGLAYELLGMPHYTIRYFEKFASLRPNDSRAWHALATVYKKVGNVNSAIKCYERAISCEPSSAAFVFQLAQLLEFHNPEKTRQLYERLLDPTSEYRLSGRETKDCLLFLSKAYLASGDRETARMYVLQLQDYAGPVISQSNSLI